MPARPDSRWEFILGGLSESGHPVPMTFEILESSAAEWAELLSDSLATEGPGALLRPARNLFAHAWFDYEFMAVGCAVGSQAVEAAFRELYPGAKESTPFRSLVRRANNDGIPAAEYRRVG
jgi:hypothetical protein